MHANGWHRTLWPLNPNATMLLDLSSDEETLRSRLSRNWAHNLRRGEKRCPTVRPWTNADPEELVHIYREMEAYKGLQRQYSEPELRSLLTHLKDNILLYRTDGEDGLPSALRACAVLGNSACDLLAASGQEARRSYATYALLWTLLTQCRERGVTSYDLGGVDPVGARGVYDFKKGTGAKHRQFLGEWDWSRPALLRPAACLAIRLKGTA
jgi:lipid II:glycine glycyltransferase (peptidoglycan interpeptide bridge formation enzyme)